MQRGGDFRCVIPGTTAILPGYFIRAPKVCDTMNLSGISRDRGSGTHQAPRVARRWPERYQQRSRFPVSLRRFRPCLHVLVLKLVGPTSLWILLLQRICARYLIPFARSLIPLEGLPWYRGSCCRRIEALAYLRISPRARRRPPALLDQFHRMRDSFESPKSRPR